MLTHRMARPLLAGIFVVDGIDAVLHAGTRFAATNDAALPVTRLLRRPENTKSLVRINGAVQLTAGLLLGAGFLPRPMAMALGSALLPSTLTGHAFWNESDVQTRAAQRTQFLKNASILGGLLLAATDTDGNPSVAWRAHRAFRRASTTVDRAATRVAASATGVAQALPHIVDAS